MTKTLYMLISDGGDGSQSLHYTFDSELIDRMSDDTDFDVIGENYMSGDGLQIKEITVPTECTYESLSISKWNIISREDYKELFDEEQ